ncbi:hypothetical protein G6F32_017299 [Rhizopus arrhizus]|nr:hypothetical protein G6F32_017299 [Rhizopus arrhizus]
MGSDDRRGRDGHRRPGGDVHQRLWGRPVARLEDVHHRCQHLPGGHGAVAGDGARGHPSRRARQLRHAQPFAVFPAGPSGPVADGRARPVP